MGSRLAPHDYQLILTGFLLLYWDFVGLFVDLLGCEMEDCGDRRIVKNIIGWVLCMFGWLVEPCYGGWWGWHRGQGGWLWQMVNGVASLGCCLVY